MKITPIVCGFATLNVTPPQWMHVTLNRDYARMMVAATRAMVRTGRRHFAGAYVSWTKAELVVTMPLDNYTTGDLEDLRMRVTDAVGAAMLSVPVRRAPLGDEQPVPP